MGATKDYLCTAEIGAHILEFSFEYLQGIILWRFYVKYMTIATGAFYYLNFAVHRSNFKGGNENSLKVTLYCSDSSCESKCHVLTKSPGREIFSHGREFVSPLLWQSSD